MDKYDQQLLAMLSFAPLVVLLSVYAVSTTVRGFLKAVRRVFPETRAWIRFTDEAGAGARTGRARGL